MVHVFDVDLKNKQFRSLTRAEKGSKWIKTEPPSPFIEPERIRFQEGTTIQPYPNGKSKTI